MRLLLDEMYPPRTAVHLRDDHVIDAVPVRDLRLDGHSDDEVASAARRSGRVVVTENAEDFASFGGLVVLIVRKQRLPHRGAQASALATVIASWTKESSNLPPGVYWPPAVHSHGGYRASSGAGTAEPGTTAHAGRASYVHRSHDLGLNVDVTCVGEVLEVL